MTMFPSTLGLVSCPSLWSLYLSLAICIDQQRETLDHLTQLCFPTCRPCWCPLRCSHFGRNIHFLPFAFYSLAPHFSNCRPKVVGFFYHIIEVLTFSLLQTPHHFVKPSSHSQSPHSQWVFCGQPYSQSFLKFTYKSSLWQSGQAYCFVCVWPLVVSGVIIIVKVVVHIVKSAPPIPSVPLIPW